MSLMLGFLHLKVVECDAMIAATLMRGGKRAHFPRSPDGQRRPQSEARRSSGGLVSAGDCISMNGQSMS